MEQALNRAATKIQSTFRGYKTRKNMLFKTKSNQDINNNKENNNNNEQMTNNKMQQSSRPISKSQGSFRPSSSGSITDPEQAAIKIQSTFRGYKTRKQLHASRTALGAQETGNNYVTTVQSDYHRNVKSEGRQTKLK